MAEFADPETVRKLMEVLNKAFPLAPVEKPEDAPDVVCCECGAMNQVRCYEQQTPEYHEWVIECTVCGSEEVDCEPCVEIHQLAVVIHELRQYIHWITHCLLTEEQLSTEVACGATVRDLTAIDYSTHGQIKLIAELERKILEQEDAMKDMIEPHHEYDPRDD